MVKTPMGLEREYGPLAHEGLEVAERDDGLELANPDHGPEVVPGSSPPLDRDSTARESIPIPLHDDAQDPHASQFYGYHVPEKTAGGVPTGSDGSAGHLMGGGTKSPKKYLGMRKRTFIIALVAIIVVVLAAVLGGVLGTVLPDQDDDDDDDTFDSADDPSTTSIAPIKVRSTSGLAATLSGDSSGRMYTYYQDTNGRIIENSYLNGSWALDNQSNINNAVVLGSGQAQAGSPLAAISYSTNATLFRQVFFFNPAGVVQTVTSSETNAQKISQNWTSPIAIMGNDTVTTNAVGLAACYSSRYDAGMRIYYGSDDGYVQEVIRKFNSSAYKFGYSINESDTSSGVGCTVYDADTSNTQFYSVYFRNSTSGVVQQAYFYPFGDQWDTGVPFADIPVDSGTDIAACTDAHKTDYVFFQLSNSKLIVRGELNPDFTDYDTVLAMQNSTSNSNLAAAFVNGGALYMFQNDSSTSRVWYADVSRSGIVVMNGTET